MKTYISLLTLSVSTLLFLSGCTLFNADLKTARNLEGDWDITSYTIDGEEQMGFWFSRIVMEFDEYDKGNDEGDFTITFTYTTGETEPLHGEYLVDDDGGNLEVAFDNGALENWNIDLEKDDLDMDAVFDGISYVIKAERD